MNKKILPLVLLSFSSLKLFAQPLLEKHSFQQELSAFDIEKLNISQQLKSNKSIEVDSKFLSLDEGQSLIPSIDYLDPLSMLQSKGITPTKEHHNISSVATLAIQGSIDGRTLDKATCEEIRDTYQFKKNGMQYEYNNTYFVINEESNSIINVVILIDRKVGFLQEQFKIVKKIAKNSNKLLIYPNPASHTVNLGYKIDYKSTYSLTILSMNGNVEQTVFSNKTIVPGTYEENISINLIPGVYLVRLNDSKNSIQEQLIISK